MTGAPGSLAFRGPGIEDSMQGVTTNPSPSQAAGGESWSSRQALSVNLFSNSLIPLTKFPEPFCSLILRKAHNRIMPQSSCQLDLAQPRTACAAKHWSTMPPSLPSPFPVRKIPPFGEICCFSQKACIFSPGRIFLFFASGWSWVSPRHDALLLTYDG